MENIGWDEMRYFFGLMEVAIIDVSISCVLKAEKPQKAIFYIMHAYSIVFIYNMVRCILGE